MLAGRRNVYVYVCVCVCLCLCVFSGERIVQVIFLVITSGRRGEIVFRPARRSLAYLMLVNVLYNV